MSKSSDEMDDGGLGDNATYSSLWTDPCGVSRSVTSTTGTATQRPDVDDSMVTGGTPEFDGNTSTEELVVSG